MSKQIQSTHQEFCRASHSAEIILLAENLQSPENYGLLMRTSESMGVKKCYFITSDYQEITPRMKRCSRSAEKYLEVEFSQSSKKIIEDYRKNNFIIISLEKTNNSILITDFSLKTYKILLLLGNEKSGVSEEILSLSHAVVHIDMYGKNSSMNVVNATGIALFHITNLFKIKN
ncbi:MAG: TrmH family RNA methyltransferase [Flavobacteriaceae bacterium]|nr:TrmH family RNA methyltransferase [Flavobacteriaceae bacterium]